MISGVHLNMLCNLSNYALEMLYLFLWRSQSLQTLGSSDAWYDCVEITSMIVTDSVVVVCILK